MIVEVAVASDSDLELKCCCGVTWKCVRISWWMVQVANTWFATFTSSTFTSSTLTCNLNPARHNFRRELRWVWRGRGCDSRHVRWCHGNDKMEYINANIWFTTFTTSTLTCNLNPACKTQFQGWVRVCVAGEGGGRGKFFRDMCDDTTERTKSYVLLPILSALSR